jgi:DNA-binding PadR family transcriptional regulator
MNPSDSTGLSLFEYHVLLALAAGPLHGYAIKDAVAMESEGALEPRAGSMYRVIARLTTSGLVTGAADPHRGEPHPGLARRCYALTVAGRSTLAAEAARLKRAAAKAESRLRVARSR